MAKVLLKNKLDEMLSRMEKSGADVFAPMRKTDSSFYGKINSSKEIAFDLILPDRTVKELFFPRTEPMMMYAVRKQSVDVEDVSPAEKKRVIFGITPCDAAALAIDDSLFGWDYQDAYWFNRRKNSVIVSIACTKCDAFCMCTSLNLSPDSTRGSDVQLIPLKNTEGWQVKEITERGKEFLAGICDLLSDSNEQAAEIAKVEKKFDLNTVTKKLNGNGCFDSDLWSKMSPRCLGCGVCTYLCPTCHCFDIQDEGDTYHGVRRKNWDSCSFEMFTMHTSGHNPRPNQSSRWRQRIMHKFNYFPEKFKDVSCSGCGRCTRNCPVDMGITETLQTLSNS